MIDVSTTPTKVAEALTAFQDVCLRFPYPKLLLLNKAEHNSPIAAEIKRKLTPALQADERLHIVTVTDDLEQARLGFVQMAQHYEGRQPA